MHRRVKDPLGVYAHIVKADLRQEGIGQRPGQRAFDPGAIGPDEPSLPGGRGPQGRAFHLKPGQAHLATLRLIGHGNAGTVKDHGLRCLCRLQRPFANVEIAVRHPAPPLGTGQIFVRSPMLFMDYVGDSTDNTAAVRDGEWLSVRDMGYIDAQGYLCLVGRENRMVVTQGKNLFPEEVELVLLSCPEVLHASVQGVPDPIRGQQVIALVYSTHSANTLSTSTLAEVCREQLESYKIPKRFFICTEWPMTVSGKTDHAALALKLKTYFQNSEDSIPCIHPLL